MNRKTAIQTSLLCQIALCVAIMCISAYINIPLPFIGVPITAQTFVVNIIALMLKPKYALIAQVIYTLIGIAGIPVFAGGKAGIGTLAGPSGGYIIGFIVAAFLISLAKNGKCELKRYILITIFVGIPVIYLLGTTVMAFQVKKGIWALLMTTVFPFIPLDIIKCIAASYICIKLNRVLTKMRLI